MKKSSKILVVVNLLFLMGYFNWSIMAKEKIVNEGTLVLLQLEPVDPRSLMQGDYMTLSYAITDIDQEDKIPKRGFCVLKKDAKGVAGLVRYQSERTPLKKDELLVKYFSDGNIWFRRLRVGAESYFFEEGSAKRFEQAKYGVLRVDQDGNSVLVGLADTQQQIIRP